MANKALSALALVLSAAVSGCAGSDLHFYMLEPLAQTSPAPTPVPDTIVVGLGPVHLPEYLNRPQMVIATGEHQYQFDEHHRWAEHLDQNISRVLVQQLSQQLGLKQVLRYPWAQRQAVDYQLVIDVLEFHQTASLHSRLKGQWQIKRADQTLLSQQFACSIDSDDQAENIVAAQSQCLHDLGLELAAAVRQLQGSQPK